MESTNELAWSAYSKSNSITDLAVDCIVNAANNSLLGGGGVDGAIHNAAGRELYNECKTLNGCDTGDAKITKGYKLPAKHVIHTVGPRGKKPEVLKRSYERCFEVMLENNLRSIAFPCISTGVYGYPSKDAAGVAISTCRTFLEQHHSEIDKVVFCLFTRDDIDAYHHFLPRYFPVDNVALPSAPVTPPADAEDKQQRKRLFEDEGAAQVEVGSSPKQSRCD